MTASTHEETQATSSRLSGRLGVLSIVFMVVAAAAPLTIIVSSPLNMLASNGAGLPVAYLIGPLLLLVFAGGYAAMSMKIKKSGAFYSYVTAGIGRPIGVGAGFMAMFGYMVFQSFVFVLMGFTTEGTLAAFGSPVNLPWWGWTVLMYGVVAVLGYLNIDISAKVLSVALILEVLVILVVDFAIILQGGGPEGMSIAVPFSPEVLFAGSFPLALIFGISIGLGFEATAVFRDEARDPEKTIPRAIYTSVIAAALFYGFALWALIQGFGNSAVMDEIGGLDDPTTLFYIASDTYVGAIFTQIVYILAITSMFACVLSYHNIVARYLHSLGHSVLPLKLSTVHPTHKSPHVASITTTAIGLVFFAVTLLSGMDPFVFMQWEIAIATLSFVMLLTVTSVAILVFFWKNKALRNNLWTGVVSPAFSIVIFAALVVTALANFGSLSFADPSVNIVLQLIPVVLLLIGAGVALLARSRNPERYAGLADDTSAVEAKRD